MKESKNKKTINKTIISGQHFDILLSDQIEFVWNTKGLQRNSYIV